MSFSRTGDDEPATDRPQRLTHTELEADARSALRHAQVLLGGDGQTPYTERVTAVLANGQVSATLALAAAVSAGSGAIAGALADVAAAVRQSSRVTGGRIS